MYIRADSMSDVTLMLLERSDYELARQTSKEEQTMIRIILEGPRPTQLLLCLYTVSGYLIESFLWIRFSIRRTKQLLCFDQGQKTNKILQQSTFLHFKTVRFLLLRE